MKLTPFDRVLVISRRATLITNFERIRKCQQLPAADLETKYRKAYAALIKDTQEVASSFVRSLCTCGFDMPSAWGQVEKTVKLRELEARLEKIKDSFPAGDVRRSLSASMYSGDWDTFLNSAFALRGIFKNEVIRNGGAENEDCKTELLRQCGLLSEPEQLFMTEDKGNVNEGSGFQQI